MYKCMQVMQTMVIVYVLNINAVLIKFRFHSCIFGSTERMLYSNIAWRQLFSEMRKMHRRIHFFYLKKLTQSIFISLRSNI